MFAFIQLVAEERIRVAQEEGQFENLEGMGRPIVYEDDSHVPEDLRMAYKILRNSGHLPPEILEERQIHNAIDLLEHLDDEQERYRQLQKVNVLIARMNERRRTPVRLTTDDEYFRRIVEKVRVAERRAAEREGYSLARPDAAKSAGGPGCEAL